VYGQTKCLNPCDHQRTISSMIYYNDLKKKEVRKVEEQINARKNKYYSYPLTHVLGRNFKSKFILYLLKYEPTTWVNIL